MGVLVNKPLYLQKGGNGSTIAYSRVSLKALISDAYFEDDENWSKVVFYYRDATGNQKTYVNASAAGGVVSGTMKVSSRARGNTWQLYKILIVDFDGGSYVIQRSSLDSSDDIVVSN